MKYKATITIEHTFEAENEQAAKDKTESWQEYLATSNSGSEILANAPVDIIELNL